MEHLKLHISKFVDLSEDDLDAIIEYFSVIKVSKKQNLSFEGKICPANYFVLNGCLRLFFLNEKGVEQTVQFAIENWWLSDYASFSSQKIAAFSIQVVEDSEIAVLDYAKQEELLKHFPAMEKYFRMVHQKAHAAYQFRIKLLYSNSREEIYRSFIASFPSFVQRIPQYLLASYLGFTPEYLSEIRRKIIS